LIGSKNGESSKSRIIDNRQSLKKWDCLVRKESQ